MKLVFDTRGNEKQKECCRAWNDPNVTEIIFGGAKGGAKSFTGCKLIFYDALTYPGTHYFIAREKLNDLRKFTIPSIYECFEDWGIKLTDYLNYNGQDSFFTAYNDSKVFLIEASFMPSDPLFQRFGSMQMTRGWIEEAGEFVEAAKNNLAASIGRWKNDIYNLSPKLLQTCNPAKNYLYIDYRKFRDGTLEPWKRFIQALPTDNKKLSQEYIENLRRSLSKNEKERLLLGNWEYDDDPTVLCDYDAIVDMFTNEHVLPDPSDPAISADLAMQGRDRFVAGAWNGLVCSIKIDKEKSTGKEIEEDLRDLMIKKQIGHSQTVVDSDGMGSYLESYLQDIMEFHGGSQAVNKEEFANLKSECAYKLAEVINKRQIRVLCSDEQRERIIDEMGVLKAKSVDTDETRKRIIKKEEMKELLGHSPDYMDMLLMRMMFLIQPSVNWLPH